MSYVFQHTDEIDHKLVVRHADDGVTFTASNGAMAVSVDVPDVDVRRLGNRLERLLTPMPIEATSVEVTNHLTVYITVGNSDNRLPQLDWVLLLRQVSALLNESDHATVHFEGYTSPDSPRQTACWCVEWSAPNDGGIVSVVEHVRMRLRELAYAYHQREVCWAEAHVEMLRPIVTEAAVVMTGE